MAYTNFEGREQLLTELARAVDELALALACLGEAYEQLDEQTADKLEQQLFKPVQVAYGRAQRGHAEFANRHGLAGRAFELRSPGMQSQSTRELIERAAAATTQADHELGTLQDSMLPVEVGDAELRGVLSDVRGLIDAVPAGARNLVRTLGR